LINPHYAQNPLNERNGLFATLALGGTWYKLWGL
jgi:hypothetical protein